jgi:hypothetical protein
MPLPVAGYLVIRFAVPPAFFGVAVSVGLHAGGDTGTDFRSCASEAQAEGASIRAGSEEGAVPASSPLGVGSGNPGAEQSPPHTAARTEEIGVAFRGGMRPREPTGQRRGRSWVRLGRVAPLGPIQRPIDCAARMPYIASVFATALSSGI